MSTGSSTQVARRGVFPRLRDARIRAKLALILVVPLVAVIALATARLVDVGQRATEAGTVEELTKLETDISGLTQLLHVERMAAAAYVATRAASPPATRRPSGRATPRSRSTARTGPTSKTRRAPYATASPASTTT